MSGTAATGRRVVFEDQTAVDVIKTLPPYARSFDPRAKAWRIHPAYADRLAVILARLGYNVVRNGGRSSRQGGAR